MIIGPNPNEVRPFDALSQPEDRGVVTLRELTDTVFERTVTFPDGSAQVSIIGDTSAWRRGSGEAEDAPVAKEGPAAMGADAAARRLAEASSGKLLYCHAAETWFAWDGAVWRRDRGGVRRAIRAVLREAGVAEPAPSLVAGAEALAREELALMAEPGGPAQDADASWDTDPWRLGTPDGTVDLVTGVLHPADPGDRITRATAVAPAETADCPRWRRFLHEAMAGDAALVSFLQRFCGYALTGETCEHALLFGLGEGGNGKSVFVNTVRSILGTYAAVAAPDLFAQGAERRASKAHSTEIAMLAGARLVTASETEEGRVWADGRLKLLTGGDPVTARFLGRDHFTFTPRFKLIVVGNHMPVLRTVDAALRRRLCVVPFATRPAVPDRMLESKLKAEWPGILRWMIEGCLAWQGRETPNESPEEKQEGRLGDRPEGGLGGGSGGGLCRPASVGAATDAYLAGQDLVGQFLGEWCERGETCLETAADLYAAWCAFARAAGEPPGTQRRFAARLDRQTTIPGLTRERLRHARLYRGIRLLRPGERQAEVYEARRGGG